MKDLNQHALHCLCSLVCFVQKIISEVEGEIDWHFYHQQVVLCNENILVSPLPMVLCNSAVAVDSLNDNGLRNCVARAS